MVCLSILAPIWVLRTLFLGTGTYGSALNFSSFVPSSTQRAISYLFFKVSSFMTRICYLFVYIYIYIYIFVGFWWLRCQRYWAGSAYTWLWGRFGVHMALGYKAMVAVL